MNDDDLAALLREHAERHLVPGATLGILRDGSLKILCHGVGDASTGEPVTPDSRFSLGSLTKPMVATVVARLAEAGRVSLADLVSAHVPELRDAIWAQRATVEDLLASRSGIPLRSATEFGFDAHADADDAALSRLVAEVGIEPDANATDFWSYTNVGWCVLGRIIEAVTGMPWETAMRQVLLDPAQMGMTDFASDAGAAPRVSGHHITNDGATSVKPLVARAYGPAGASMVSTCTDLLRFAELHLADPSLAYLRAAHSEVAIRGWLDAWCLGWARFDCTGGPIWGWDGLIDGERSFLRLLPEQGVAIALLTNADSGRAMYRSLFAGLLGSFGIELAPLDLEPKAGTAGDLSRYGGEYAWPDRSVRVSSLADSLLITTHESALEALPLDERTFLVDPADPDNPTVTFDAFDADGRPRVLYQMLWGLPRGAS